MKTINFKNFTMFNDISKETSAIVDARRDVADNIYKSTNGIAALDLSLKIYNSTGAIELSDEEYALLEAFINTCTPRFIESFRANVKEK